jgi:hypothetical protein
MGDLMSYEALANALREAEEKKKKKKKKKS